MIAREEALALVEEKIKNQNLRRHMLATEAIMRRLAERFGEDALVWGQAGLLHDIDLESIDDDPRRHARTAGEWLADKLPPEAVQAIRAHNGEVLGVPRESRLDHALCASETVTGLIVAMALILPDRKLENVKAKSILKRMKEPHFAAGASRECIGECSRFGMELPDFIALAVEAMKAIHEELGL